MIEEARGSIDYHEQGSGPTVVFVPGSCSTGAAWRPVMATWQGRYRCVTTSLLGYGGTKERRSGDETDIALEAEIVEAVIRRAGGSVHLVGHSFGGLVALSVALRGQANLKSLTILEAPAMELLAATGEHQHYLAFRNMTDAYFANFRNGDAEAIASMIDFYGGVGTFSDWPPHVKAYAVETTPVNIQDWATAFGFPLSPAGLTAVKVDCAVLFGAESHPAARRANELLGLCIPTASFEAVLGAAHFMIATHPQRVANALERHFARTESMRP